MASDKKQALFLAGGICLLGLLMSSALAWREHRNNHSLVEQQLALHSQRLIAQIELRLDSYEPGLRALRSVVQLLQPESLTLENFQRFQRGRDLEKEFPGARGFGFIRRVPAADEVGFMQAARVDAGGAFDLTQLAPHPGERYVIQYIEPIESNKPALGLDIASEPKRKTAADWSARQGQPTLTAPITLVQAPTMPLRGFLLLLPVYHADQPQDTEIQRVQATLGWTHTPLIIDEILSRIDLQHEALGFSIADMTEDQSAQVFFSSLSDDEAPLGDMSYQLRRQIYGRDWQFAISPRPEFLEQFNLTSPLRVLLFGLLLSGMLAALISTYWYNQQRERLRRAEQERQLQLFNARLEEQVIERTRMLESARHDLSTILDALPSMIGYWDTSVRIRFANRAYHQWFNVPQGSLPGKHARELLSPAMYDENQRFVEATLKGEPQTFERNLPAPDGSGMKRALAHYLPDIIDNEVRGFYVLIHDITASHLAHSRLAESEAFLARTGRIAAIGGWRYDAHTGELFWTRETKHLHDIEEEITPTLEDALAFVHPDHRATLANCFEQAQQHDEGWDIELPCITANGREVWMRIIGEVERDPQGHRLVQGIYQDITDAHHRRETHQALTQAMAAAEAANAAKSQFLANMSHEIRTPLNAVIGLSYLLGKSRLDPHQKSLLAKIQVASDTLLGLINDVLDLSKIEAQQMVLDPVPFKLNDLLRDLRQLMTSQAESKHLDLIIHPTPGLPGHLRGDVTRIKQILVNLLNNAIKFTEQGHVKLTVWSTKTTRFECWLHFSVRDTGIGIPADSQQRLFKPFTQADASTTRRFGGSGLGLSIVQRLTELMGGRLGFSSVEGVGSEFWVEFPLQLDLPEYAAEALRKDQLELLFLSNDATLCAQATDAADALGWSATVVPSLEKAIAKLHQAGITGLHFHVVAGDPDCVGKCQRWYSDNAHSPLYRRSGEVVPPLWIPWNADPEQAPDNVMAKPTVPITAINMFNRFSRAARQHSAQAIHVLESTTLTVSDFAWLPGVRVLVVDDSDINREVASRILQREGALIETACNGQEALTLLETAINHLPTLILMDIQMPVLDGIQATRRIKQNPALSAIPVIALTAGALVAERQRAIEAGMVAFVSKPLDPAALIRLLRRQVEVTCPEFVPVGAPPPFETLTGAQHEWPVLNSIDTAHAIRQFGNDAALYRRILSNFLEQYADIACLTISDISQEARVALAARLHKLRGSAALLGARLLATHSKDLERALRADRLGTTALQDIASGLVANFLTLQREAHRALAVDETAVSLPACPPTLRPADRFAIHSLHELLRQQDLHALAVFEPLSEALQQVLGEDDFAHFKRCIVQLDFSGARAVLDQHALV